MEALDGDNEKESERNKGVIGIEKDCGKVCGADMASGALAGSGRGDGSRSRCAGRIIRQKHYHGNRVSQQPCVDAVSAAVCRSGYCCHVSDGPV